MNYSEFADQITSIYRVATQDLIEENKRLREALEKIAKMPLSMSWQHHLLNAVALAQDALKEEA